MMTSLYNIMHNIFHNQAICILGVDGTGKSSATVLLKELLGQYGEIQYMGFHSYLTKLARNRFHSGIHGNGVVSVIKNFTAVLFEMWYRVIRHWPESKIVIYDRYAWEYYIPLRGIKKAVAKIIFKTLFPKPKYVFYFHCPIEVSLSRKTDIHDIQEFTDMKKEYDRAFMNLKNIISIDTSINDIPKIISIITNALPKDFISNVTGEQP